LGLAISKQVLPHGKTLSLNGYPNISGEAFYVYKIMEGKMKLSENLKRQRNENPDEWLMGEFIRKAQVLEVENELQDKIIKTQQEHIDALKELITLNKGE
jgi:hypothetical protein